MWECATCISSPLRIALTGDISIFFSSPQLMWRREAGYRPDYLGRSGVPAPCADVRPYAGSDLAQCETFRISGLRTVISMPASLTRWFLKADGHSAERGTVMWQSIPVFLIPSARKAHIQEENWSATATRPYGWLNAAADVRMAAFLIS